ncbi:hypothetical protein F4775DRAFT_271755 [Biscogniauxia sp. FL1348]|nr:hypothetical protein F4775DRAFT_271755 [Biscogniauxia sp. FL1348]
MYPLTFQIVRVTSRLVPLAWAAPFDVQHVSARWSRPWQNETGSAIFREQLQNPSEVFSVLLIIGGDIVQKAVAQLSGRRVTFVVFSFGWVSYAFNSLMSAFGDGSLMPDPDVACEVITVSSGIKKSSNSWTLGRLLRDLEAEVKPTRTWHELVEDEDDDMPGDFIKTTDPTKKCKKVGEHTASLLITICTAQSGAGLPQRDGFFSLYLFIILLQLIVSAIPTILWGNWSILFLTVLGTVLAVVTASLKEWRLEKYQARRHSKHTYAITRGNGHRHVFIIEPGVIDLKTGKYPGLYLDDLAGAVRKADNWTRVKSVILAVVWIWYLIMAGGTKENTWFLLAVGMLGMVQNVYAAGRHQRSEAHGIPLKLGSTYGTTKLDPRLVIRGLMTKRKKQNVYQRNPPRKTMKVLQDVEIDYPGVGQALVLEFFPNRTAWRAGEVEWWEQAKRYSDYLDYVARHPPTPGHPAIPEVHQPNPPDGYVRLRPTDGSAS